MLGIGLLHMPLESGIAFRGRTDFVVNVVDQILVALELKLFLWHSGQSCLQWR